MNHTATTDLVRRLYAAYNAQDVAALDAMMGPDVTMHVGGNHPLSGTYRGRDEVWPYLARVAGIIEPRGDRGFEVHAITADDEGHAVALLRGYTGDFSRPIVHIWHVADGLAQEYWDTTMDQLKEDAFWNSVLS